MLTRIAITRHAPGTPMPDAQATLARAPTPGQQGPVCTRQLRVHTHTPGDNHGPCWGADGAWGRHGSLVVAHRRRCEAWAGPTGLGDGARPTVRHSRSSDRA